MKIRKLWALLSALTLHAGIAPHPEKLSSQNGKSPISAYTEPHVDCFCDHRSSSFLQTRKRIKGEPCECKDPFGPPKNRSADELIYAPQCHLSNDDLAFWRLTKTEINPEGLVLNESTAYALQCADCQRYNLACTDPVPITKGVCGCFWKADGADLIMKQLTCLDCASQCIGKVESFVTGEELQPVMVRGVCIRKKDYAIDG